MLAPHTNIPEKASGQIQIYVDDKLIYTSPMVGRKTDKFEFEVDITGAEYVKIVYSVKEDFYKYDEILILMDVNLWK